MCWNALKWTIWLVKITMSLPSGDGLASTKVQTKIEHKTCKFINYLLDVWNPIFKKTILYSTYPFDVLKMNFSNSSIWIEHRAQIVFVLNKSHVYECKSPLQAISECIIRWKLDILVWVFNTKTVEELNNIS